jgi:hypothetical protein
MERTERWNTNVPFVKDNSGKTPKRDSLQRFTIQKATMYIMGIYTVWLVGKKGFLRNLSQ